MCFFRRQICENRPWRTQRTTASLNDCTTTDNRKWQYPNRKYTYISKGVVEIATAGLRGVFDHSELEETISVWPTDKNGRRNRKYLHLWNYERKHWDSNGKSRVNYDHTSSNKVSASDCDSDRQREITMAAKTTGTVYIFGMTAAKFQQQI